jgi:hypothetical protein
MRAMLNKLTHILLILFLSFSFITASHAQQEKSSEPNFFATFKVYLHYFISLKHFKGRDLDDYHQELQKALDKITADQPYRIKLLLIAHSPANIEKGITFDKKKAKDLIKKYDSFLKNFNADENIPHEVIDEFLVEKATSREDLVRAYMFVKFRELAPPLSYYDYLEKSSCDLVVATGLVGMQAVRKLLTMGKDPLLIILHSSPIIEPELFEKSKSFAMLNIHSEKHIPYLEREKFDDYNIQITTEEPILRLKKKTKLFQFLVKAEAGAIHDTVLKNTSHWNPSKIEKIPQE